MKTWIAKLICKNRDTPIHAMLVIKCNLEKNDSRTYESNSIFHKAIIIAHHILSAKYILDLQLFYLSTI